MVSNTIGVRYTYLCEQIGKDQASLDAATTAEDANKISIFGGQVRHNTRELLKLLEYGDNLETIAEQTDTTQEILIAQRADLRTVVEAMPALSF